MFETKKLHFENEDALVDHFQYKTLENLEQTYEGVKYLHESDETHINIFTTLIGELSAAINFIVDDANALEVLENLLISSVEIEEYKLAGKIQKLIKKIQNAKDISDINQN